MVAEITNDLRRYSVDAQHIGHAFAGLHGLNPTDLQALIAVMDAELLGDPITPGRLGEQLNLSSGSVTALIDRLERAGHIRRDRDTADRRKVLLHYADQGRRPGDELLRPAGRAYRRGDGPVHRRRAGGRAPVHGRHGAPPCGSHRDDMRAARAEPPRRPAD